MTVTIVINLAAAEEGSLELVPVSWVTASQLEDGSWMVTEVAADGSYADTRPATDAEVLLAEQVAASV